jgi:hypothetical protein
MKKMRRMSISKSGIARRRRERNRRPETYLFPPDRHLVRDPTKHSRLNKVPLVPMPLPSHLKPRLLLPLLYQSHNLVELYL